MIKSITEYEYAIDIEALLTQTVESIKVLSQMNMVIPDEANEFVAILRRLVTAEHALEQSVKLQSHYARSLNEYDQGQRMTFASGKDWVQRLVHLESIGAKVANLSPRSGTPS